jgi:hypothetical protein
LPIGRVPNDIGFFDETAFTDVLLTSLSLFQKVYAFLAEC